MKIVHGGGDLPLIESIGRGWYAVRCDKHDDGEGGYAYAEEFVNHKPTLDEIKQLVLGWIDARTDERILSGYSWRDMSVWLSTENQFNYKAAFDLAVMTDGDSLPVTFKFGTTGNPVYHVFRTLDELRSFYTGAIAYINDVLAEGWAAKDSVDWSVYSE